MEIDPFVVSCVNSFLGTMQGTVRSGVEVVPQVIMFGRENGAPAILPIVGISEFFESKQGKAKLKPLIKETWRQISADKPGLSLVAVIVLSDARTRTVSKKEWEKMGRKTNDQFFEKPGVSETLIVQVSLADGDIAYQWPYVRSGKEIVFAPASTRLERPRGSSSLVADLWPLS
jgi:hypothetical protein